MTILTKKRAIAICFFLSATVAFAQDVAVNGTCVLGATQAEVSGISSTNYLQGVVPSCTVTPYLTGTTTLAPYQLTSGGTPQTGPFTATGLGSVNPGSWTFYAAKGVALDITLSGGIPPNVYTMPLTLTSVIPGGSSSQSSLILEDTVTSIRYSLHVSSGSLISTAIGSVGTPSSINGLVAGGNYYALQVTSGALTLVPESSTYPSVTAINLIDTVTAAVYSLYVVKGALTFNPS